MFTAVYPYIKLILAILVIPFYILFRVRPEWKKFKFAVCVAYGLFAALTLVLAFRG